MRENISIIFAVLIGVIVLIIFPLFSVMSRQDSISYNKVLTLTTEFVDSVRTKGYFTEDEYNKYLANLTSTKNIYNVQLELHERILINDINSENEDVYVEDTLIYYNKDILNTLKTKGEVSFKENDEFYIKIYNTNITTASLLYNYFARVSIPPKVINIGYGGKVSHVSGESFTKINFSSLYSPYIKLGTATNANENHNERCYDEPLGAYLMQYCSVTFDLEYAENTTLNIPFEMHNFETIIVTKEDGSKEVQNISTVDYFESQKENIAKVIQKNTSLKGFDEEEYNVAVAEDSLTYASGVISGIINITGIKFPEGVSNRKSNVVIKQGVGLGNTGVLSVEAKSRDILFLKLIIHPEVQVAGPFKEMNVNSKVEDNFHYNESIYFKVELVDFESEITNVKVKYAETGSDVGGYTYSIIEEVNSKEYWIKLQVSRLVPRQYYLTFDTKRNISQSGEEPEYVTMATQTQTFTEGYDRNKLKKVELSRSSLGSSVTPAIIKLRFYIFFPEYISGAVTYQGYSSEELKDYVDYLLKTLNIELIVRNEDGTIQSEYPINYSIEYSRLPGACFVDGIASQINSGYVNCKILLSSTTETFISDNKSVYIKYESKSVNENFTIKEESFRFGVRLRGIRIPDGFTTSYIECYTGAGNYTSADFDKIDVRITDSNDSTKSFVWINALDGLKNTYTPDETAKSYYTDMKDSVDKYKGYFVSLNYAEIPGEDDLWQDAWNESITLYNNDEIQSHIIFADQLDNIGYWIYRRHFNTNGSEYTASIANYKRLCIGNSLALYEFDSARFYRTAIYLK